LWTLIETSNIFEFLTGQKDTVPEFENLLTFSANPSVKIDTSKIAQSLTPIPFHQLPPAVKRVTFCSLAYKLQLVSKEGKN
jgi:hypothetical protein